MKPFHPKSLGVAALFSLIIVLGKAPFWVQGAGLEGSFIDVSSEHENADAIEFLEEEGVVHGHPDGTFRPDEVLNRAEALKIVIGALYEELDWTAYATSSCFNDVEPNEWYTPYVCLGKGLNIIEGYLGNWFRPAQGVNSVEALKMALWTFGVNLPPAEPWYEKMVGFASVYNLVELEEEDYAEGFTRGQMAELVARLIQWEQGTLDIYLGIEDEEESDEEILVAQASDGAPDSQESNEATVHQETDDTPEENEMENTTNDAGDSTGSEVNESPEENSETENSQEEETDEEPEDEEESQVVEVAEEGEEGTGDSLPISDSQLEKQSDLLDLINSHREDNGLETLTLDYTLSLTAFEHAHWMNETGNFSHTGEDGSTPFERCTDAGTSCDAENIAYHSSATAQNWFDLWKASSGHNANMLGEHTLIGIGVWGSYAVAVFY